MSGTLAWQSVQRAILVADSSVWAVPMVLFSFYLIAVCLSILLFEEMLVLELVLLSSLATSIFFVFDFWQAGAVLLASYFLFMGAHKIRTDMDLNVKISTWKSLQSGKSYLLFAVAFLICAQYFLTVRKLDTPMNVPDFKVTPISKKIVMPLLANFNPSFAAVKDENLSVDQFILQTQEETLEKQTENIDEYLLNLQFPAELTAQELEMIREQARNEILKSQNEVTQKNEQLALMAGHEQLADLVGRQVDGNEKIAEVFTGLVDKKLNDLFRAPSATGEISQTIPIIFTLVLLLTIYPIGSMLAIVLFLLVKTIFYFLCRWNVITIKTITVSKEVLE